MSVLQKRIQRIEHWLSMPGDTRDFKPGTLINLSRFSGSYRIVKAKRKRLENIRIKEMLMAGYESVNKFMASLNVTMSDDTVMVWELILEEVS